MEPERVSDLICSFYFPGFLVGPYLTFNEYRALVSGSLYKEAERAEEEESLASDPMPQRLVPRGRKRVAFRKMLVGLMFLGSYVVFYPEFNFHLTIEDEFEAKRLFSRYVSKFHHL